MSRKNLILVLVASIIVGSSAGLFSKRIFGSSSNPSVGPRSEIGVDQMLPVDIESQIEQWDLYQQMKGITIGTGRCPNMDQNFQLVVDFVAENGARRQVLNGGLELVVTPNPLGWSNETFLAFNDDESAICAAGGVYPLHAYPDKLLWKGVCSTGAEPELGSPARELFDRCVAAEGVVDRYFAR